MTENSIKKQSKKSRWFCWILPTRLSSTINQSLWPQTSPINPCRPIRWKPPKWNRDCHGNSWTEKGRSGSRYGKTHNAGLRSNKGCSMLRWSNKDRRHPMSVTKSSGKSLKAISTKPWGTSARAQNVWTMDNSSSFSRSYNSITKRLKMHSNKRN